MDRKGEQYFAAIIIAAVSILIGLAFWPSLSQSSGQLTKTFDSNNVTMAMPAANATSELTMCGQKAITYLVTNTTGGEVISTTNYTVSQSVGADGYLAAKITARDGKYAGRNINVTCNYQPKGYIEDAGSRAITGLIFVAFALLILIAALPNVRNGVIDFVRGR